MIRSRIIMNSRKNLRVFTNSGTPYLPQDSFAVIICTPRETYFSAADSKQAAAFTRNQLLPMPLAAKSQMFQKR